MSLWATESSPLLESTPLQRKSCWRFRCDSVLLKSKAAIGILFWTGLMSLTYGFFLNPDVIFGVASQINVTLAGNSFTVAMIATIVYAVFAIWQLFYPLAGYLADVRYGRYKVVRCSLCTMWCGLMIIASATLCLIFIVIQIGPIVFIGALFALLSYITISIASAGFFANVVQFGVDQLNDAPARHSLLFVYWFLFTLYIGISIGKLAWSLAWVTVFTSLSVGGCVLLIELIAIPISLCVFKRRWFVVDSGIGNPYKEVARVVGFARRHKIPLQRSAFTYWEDDIPTGLDLGKSKYGGPFSTEQVENVKAFFGILFILLSLGPFFTADIAASAFLPILAFHLYHDESSTFLNFSADSIPNSISPSLWSIMLVIIIPIFLKVINPLFERYLPSTLKRIGLGLCLVTVCLLCSLTVDTIGHALPRNQNMSSSVFDAGIIQLEKFYNFSYLQHIPPPSLHINPYFLTFQNILVAAAYILIYGGVFEFICAQSPHSMKGFLIGVFFAIKGLFQLIGVLGVLLPFSFWQKSPRAGLVYFLVNIVISVIGVVCFTVAARRYQYRQREEFCNVRRYVEEFYEKDVAHNPKFEDFDVNFHDDSTL